MATTGHLLVREHPLSAEGSAIEQTVLAGIGQHFASFEGSRREVYDAMLAKTPISAGIDLQEVDQDGIRGWWVRPTGAPSDKAILFLHGGCYMLGSAEAYRGFASQVAARTGIAAFVLDYPLAPEHPFPAAYDACSRARQWLAAQGIAQIALVGDSAGGALALAILNHETKYPAVASVAVFSPWLDLTFSGHSFHSPETHDPIFHPHVLEDAATTYLSGANPQDGRASPLYQIPEWLPPVAIQVGRDELLLDDARRYAQAAAEKGGQVKLDIFEGLHHVFQSSVAELPAARFALDEAAAFLNTNWS